MLMLLHQPIQMYTLKPSEVMLKFSVRHWAVKRGQVFRYTLRNLFIPPFISMAVAHLQHLAMEAATF